MENEIFPLKLSLKFSKIVKLPVVAQNFKSISFEDSISKLNMHYRTNNQ